MRINFFAEYPGDGELATAELIDFPSTVFVAAESVADYRAYRDELAGIDPGVESAYWPVLEESYWVSPFADPDELAALFAEATDLEDPVFLDLELPVQHPRLVLRYGRDFFANKRRIRTFLDDATTEVVTAEYPPVPLVGRLFEPLGVSYPSSTRDCTRCPMYYTSMIPDGLVDLVGSNVERMIGGDDQVAVGLGTIATGVLEDEPILSPSALERDLERLAAAGATTVVIFRLGGLDEAYLDVLRRFVG